MFGLKYICEFKSIHKDILWRCEISERGYAGMASVMIALADEPLSISWDKKGDDFFAPIKGSELTLRVICTENFQYINLFTSDPRMYRMDVYRSGTLYWRGYVVPDTYSESFAAPPYEVEIKAVDGFSQLTDKPYIDQTLKPFTGLRSLWQIIEDCIGVLDLNMEICDWMDLYADGMSEDISPFKQAYIDMDRVYMVNQEPSYKDMLELCVKPFAAQVFQSQGVIHIRRIISLKKDYRPELFLKNNPYRLAQHNIWKTGTDVLDLCNLEILPALQSVSVNVSNSRLEDISTELRWFDKEAWNYDYIICDSKDKTLTIISSIYDEQIKNEGVYINQTAYPLSIKFNIGTSKGSRIIAFSAKFAIQLIDDSGNTKWFNNKSGEWEEEEYVFSYSEIEANEGVVSVDFQIYNIPNDGKFVFVLYNTAKGTRDGYDILFTDIEVRFDVDETSNIDKNLSTETVINETMSEKLEITIPLSDIPSVPNSNLIYSLYLVDSNGTPTSMWHTRGCYDYSTIIQHLTRCAVHFRAVPSWMISGPVFTSEYIDLNTLLNDDKYTERIYYINAIENKASDDECSSEVIAFIRLNTNIPNKGDDCVEVTKTADKIKKSIHIGQYIFFITTTNKLFRFDTNTNRIYALNTTPVNNYIGMFEGDRSIVLVEDIKITVFEINGAVKLEQDVTDCQYATYYGTYVYNNRGSEFSRSDNTYRRNEDLVKRIDGEYHSFVRTNFEMIINTESKCYHFDNRVNANINSMDETSGINILSASDRFFIFNENDILKIAKRNSLTFSDYTIIKEIDTGFFSEADQNVYQFAFAAGAGCVLWNYGEEEIYNIKNEQAKSEKVVGLHYVNGSLYIVREYGIYQFIEEYASKESIIYELKSDIVKFPASGGVTKIKGLITKYDKYGVLISTEETEPNLYGTADGFIINVNTVTALNRANNVGGERNIIIESVIKINSEGMSITKTATLNLTQEANAIESYGDWQITASASVPTIDAKGGTSKVTVSATRTRIYTSGATDTESGTPTYSWANGTTGYTGFSLDKSTGTVTASNRRTTVGNARTCTVRVTMGTETKDVTITQEANQITDTTYSIGLGATTGTTPETALPASGGTTNLAVSGNIQYTFTSGDKSGGSFEPEVSIKEGPSSESGFGVLNGVVTALSMGTTEYPDGRTATVVASGNGVTKELPIYQGANLKTLDSITATTNPAWTETAKGETATVVVTAKYTFTSGSTSNENKTNFEITNSSAGWLTYSGNKVTSANRGTTVGPVRTAALTVSYSE